MKDKVFKYLIRFILFCIIGYCTFILYNTKVKTLREQNQEISKIEHKIKHNKIKEELEKEEKTEENKSEVDLTETRLNTIGILYIPKINLKIAIYNSVDEEALRRGVGLLDNTGTLQETKGQNVLLTTHNGDDKRDLFTNLIKLEEGDRFYTKDLKGKIVEYKVDHVSKVKPTEIFDSLIIKQDESRATLMTCTPTGINSHRLLVQGKLVKEIKDEEVKIVTEQLEKNKLVFSTYEILIIIILVFSLILFILTFKKRKEEKDIYEEHTN